MSHSAPGEIKIDAETGIESFVRIARVHEPADDDAGVDADFANGTVWAPASG